MIPTATAPPPIPPPITVEYTVEQRQALIDRGIPLDQTRPPAGNAGQYFGVLPACRDLEQIPIDGGWRFQSAAPDGQGVVVWFDWFKPNDSATLQQAIAAISAFSVCKQGGASIPMYPHSEIAKMIAPKVNTLDPRIGYGLAAVGALTIGGAIALGMKGSETTAQANTQELKDLWTAPTHRQP